MAGAAFDMLPLIEAKRDGRAHAAVELDALMRAVVARAVPDYQLAAWLMAVVCRGMTGAETAALTAAMVDSGVRLDLGGVPSPIVDKHSTGGVGDKTTLVVAPLAAASGLTVAKMSGRGLGHTGGTLDKLESFPGLSVDLDAERFRDQARTVGLVIAGQSADLAPADGVLYALRDVTGTVPSLPLIASSIMSKKLAAGAEAIVLDVKVGRGAFLPTAADARALAEAMIALGAAADPPRRVIAQLSAMDAPLGRAVGNALEVREALATLRGDGPPDLERLSLRLAALLHVAAGTAPSVAAALPRVESALRSGAALERLRAMVAAQGGDAAAVDDPDRLPRAPVVRALEAVRGGVVAAIDARALGDVAVALGAGRRVKGAPVDHAVGIVLAAAVGEPVTAGQPLATVYARDASAAAEALEALARHIVVDDAPPGAPSGAAHGKPPGAGPAAARDVLGPTIGLDAADHGRPGVTP